MTRAVAVLPVGASITRSTVPNIWKVPREVFNADPPTAYISRAGSPIVRLIANTFNATVSKAAMPVVAPSQPAMESVRAYRSATITNVPQLRTADLFSQRIRVIERRPSKDLFKIAPILAATAVFSLSQQNIVALQGISTLPSIISKPIIFLETAVPNTFTANTVNILNSLKKKVGTTRLLPEDRSVADAAYRDARHFFARIGIQYSPNISVFEDGMVSFEWQGYGRGVMIVFPGNGTAAFSIRKKFGNYSRNVREIQVAGAIPNELSAAIFHLQSGADD